MKNEKNANDRDMTMKISCKTIDHRCQRLYEAGADRGISRNAAQKIRTANCNRKEKTIQILDNLLRKAEKKRSRSLTGTWVRLKKPYTATSSGSGCERGELARLVID
jgi:hypothetical protein